MCSEYISLFITDNLGPLAVSFFGGISFCLLILWLFVPREERS